MTTTSRDRPPVMPITSPRPLVAPSTRRRPVPDAKVGSMVRSPQGLWRRRREDEHHRRVVRGDDRNVPDATRWGERASFEPTSGLRARRSTPKKVAIQEEGFKKGPGIREPITLASVHTLGRISAASDVCPLFITRACTGTCTSTCTCTCTCHMHMDMCMCTCTCILHAVRCLTQTMTVIFL